MNFADLNKLEFNDSGSWPLGVKVFAIALIAVFLAGSGYWFLIDNQLTTLETARLQEQQLRQQQSRWSSANYSHLRFHDRFLALFAQAAHSINIVPVPVLEIGM